MYVIKDAHCKTCNKVGPHMETWFGFLCGTCGTRFGAMRGAKKVVMPNGVDGYNCEKCCTFCSYVEPNQMDGSYVCPDCRGVGVIK